MNKGGNLFTTSAVFLLSLLSLANSQEPNRYAGEISDPRPSLRAGLFSEYGVIPLQFIPNIGQLDDRVDFYVKGIDKSIFFSEGGLTFTLLNQEKLYKASRRGKLGEAAPPTASSWVVKLDFVNARPEAHPEGLDESEGIVSFFTGDPETWRSGIRLFSKIIYRDLWPGIDLEYSGTLDRIKYEFIVHPGADPKEIRLAYRGAETVSMDSQGRLWVHSPLQDFMDDIPTAYQGKGEGRRQIKVAYNLDSVSAEQEYASASKDLLNSSQARFSFRVGEYDRGETLIIDPAVLVYCGYVGGGGDDYINDITVDQGGNAYIVGSTESTQTTFPVTVGPDLSYGGAMYDAFVAKINASGTAIVYCGYIGGAGIDTGRGIAVDNSGQIYVTGTTTSTQASFPEIVGPDLTSNGGTDGFVAKVNASGTGLIYCGFLGGSGADETLKIALDTVGNAYVAGTTGSTHATFPVVVGPDLTHNGIADAFVAKINASGTAFDYCGYIGGSGRDEGFAVAVDSYGNAYVTGETASSPATFPVVVGPKLTCATIYYDAFVAKVNSDGSALEYCGYIGGSDVDGGLDVAVDPNGSAYVTGYTSSWQDFPRVIGPDLTYNSFEFSQDAFVVKVTPNGDGFAYSGFIGGMGIDKGNSITVDASGSAHIAGTTDSLASSFPVIGGPDLTSNGGADAFIAKVNAYGTGLVYAGYIGGTSNDTGMAVAVDSEGNAYIAGQRGYNSGGFPELGGPDLTYNGGTNDAYVAKVHYASPTVSFIFPANAATVSGSVPIQVDAYDQRGVSAVDFFIDGIWVNTDATYPYSYKWDASGLTGSHTIRAVASILFNLTADVQITVNVVDELPPLIVVHPLSQTVVNGSAVIMTVEATGTAPLSFQWYRGASGDASDPIVGAVSDRYTIPSVTSPDSLWVCVTNGYGQAISNTAVLSLGMPSSLEGLIYDNSNEGPLGGAVVILGGYPQVISDGNGRYRVSGLVAGNYPITISRTGYITHADTIGITSSTSSSRNFRLSPIGGNGVRIVSITSKYNGFVYFLDGVDFIVTFTAHVDWGGHAPGSVRFITSAGQYDVAVTGNEISRSLNVGREFASCSTLKAVAISSDGTQSPVANAEFVMMEAFLPALLFNINDRGDSFYYKSKWNDFEIFDESLERGVIPEHVPFFGQGGFLFNTSLPVEITAESSGAVDIKMDIKPAENKKEEWSACEMAGFRFTLTPQLRLKGQFSKAECQYDWDGYLNLNAEVNIEKSWPFVYPGPPMPIPMYLKAAFDCQADLAFGFLDVNPVALNLQGGLNPYFRGSLGAGVNKFLAVEGWIGGGADFSLQYPALPHLSDVNIYWNAGFTAYALMFKWEVEAWGGEWHLYENATGSSVLSQIPQASPKTINREYLKKNDAGRFRGQLGERINPCSSVSVISTSAIELLQESVFPYSDPMLSASGTMLGLTWIEDDELRQPNNRTVATSSVYTGSTWAAPRRLGDDGTADFHPNMLIFSDGAAVGSWEDEKIIHAESIKFEDMVSNLEISVSVYDPITDNWRPFQRITDNSYMDGSPQISGTIISDVMLVWISNEANDILGSPNAPNKLWYCIWNGMEWSTPQMIAQIPRAILKYSLIYNGEKAHIVMSLDADGDSATVADTELYRLTYSAGVWGEPMRLWADILPDVNPKLAFDTAGRAVMVWMKGNELSCSVDFAAPAAIYREEFSTNLADFKLAASNLGKLAIVWIKPTEYRSDLNVIFYDPAHSSWGVAPHQITADAEIERNVAVSFYGEDTLVAVYNRTPIETTTSSRTTADGKTIVLAIPEPGITDLYVLEYVMGRDLALRPLSLRAEPPNPEPGAGVRLTVTAANVGDETAPAIHVAFYRGNPSSGGTLIGEALAPAGLRPGDRVDLSVLWTVPETDIPLRIFAVIDPASDYDTEFRTNNSIDIEIVKADLTINGMNWEWRGADRVLITARVLNAGVIPSQATTLKFRQDSGAGILISDQILPAMAKGEFRDVTIEWDVSALALPAYPVHIAVDEENLVPEFDEADNWKMATVTPVTVPDSIVVLSPNGGEEWPDGSARSIRWATSGIVGNVGIDCSIDGGMTWSPLVTSIANSGNYSWTVAAAASSECLIRVFDEADGVPLDASDGHFTILPALSMKKVDFNGDGQEDILWRYYGSGGFQGLNVVWLMNQAMSPSPAPETADTEALPGRSLLSGAPAGVVYKAERDTGTHLAAVPPSGPKTVVSGDKPPALETNRIMRDPMDHERGRSKAVAEQNGGNAKEVRIIRKDAATAAALDDGTAKIAALQLATEIVFSQIADTGWEIAGTGDFNGDAKTDILWRYYGTGGYQGLNDIWFMDGTTFIGESVFSQISDTNWRIAGTGDFNGDGETDILWRYYGTGAYQGLNVIWYMNDAQMMGETVFSQVLDTDWRIEGTGDFNGDGETDILWRYYGTGGYQGLNDIWFMNDASFVSEAVFSQILDTNWQIGGTGDFNNDGQTDILWRYYGVGPYQGLNDIWYMNGTTFVNEEVFSLIPDTNWRIVNR